MAIVEYSGIATVSTTEWSMTANTGSISANTDDGVVQAVVDFNALANGDTYELKFYEKARSGDTQRIVWEATFVNVLGEPLVYTPSFLVMHGWDFTLLKTAGTDRAIPWSVRRIPTP
jgi:hypothetical protein